MTDPTGSGLAGSRWWGWGRRATYLPTSSGRDPGSRTSRGRRRRPARALAPRISGLLQRGLRRAAEAPLIEGNRARLLVDGVDAFPAMLHLIRRAERRVHLENYIIQDDEVGRRFRDALAERARSGVEVRVLYDWLGSFRLPRSFWAPLRAAGAEVRAFGPPSPRRPLRFLRRDHRKLLVTDGTAAVLGGLCIGREWEGTESEECWRDTAVLLEGPIARQLDLTFARLWRRSGRLRERVLSPLSVPPPAGEVVARVIDGPPAHARAYRIYQLVAALAERSVYVTGAYPLAPAPLRRALASAARSGVDVRLLAPGRSDLPMLNQAARAHYGELLAAGVRIFEWTGPMLHAKTMVVDGNWALVGSSNLNPFSLLGNFELDVEVQDSGLASRLEAQFLADLERAREIRLADWLRRPRSQRWAERFGAIILWFPYKLYDG